MMTLEKQKPKQQKTTKKSRTKKSRTKKSRTKKSRTKKSRTKKPIENKSISNKKYKIKARGSRSERSDKLEEIRRRTATKKIQKTARSFVQKPICGVCLERINDSDRVDLPFCKHSLHRHCLQQLKDRNMNTCPQCRKRLISPEELLKTRFSEIFESVYVTMIQPSYISRLEYIELPNKDESKNKLYDIFKEEQHTFVLKDPDTSSLIERKKMTGNEFINLIKGNTDESIELIYIRACIYAMNEFIHYYLAKIQPLLHRLNTNFEMIMNVLYTKTKDGKGKKDRVRIGKPTLSGISNNIINVCKRQVVLQYYNFYFNKMIILNPELSISMNDVIDRAINLIVEKIEPNFREVINEKEAEELEKIHAVLD
jgi:hypothetical protein